jgi:hypothetical protein
MRSFVYGYLVWSLLNDPVEERPIVAKEAPIKENAAGQGEVEGKCKSGAINPHISSNPSGPRYSNINFPNNSTDILPTNNRLPRHTQTSLDKLPPRSPHILHPHRSPRLPNPPLHAPVANTHLQTLRHKAPSLPLQTSPLRRRKSLRRRRRRPQGRRPKVGTQMVPPRYPARMDPACVPPKGSAGATWGVG